MTTPVKLPGLLGIVLVPDVIEESGDVYDGKQVAEAVQKFMDKEVITERTDVVVRVTPPRSISEEIETAIILGDTQPGKVICAACDGEMFPEHAHYKCSRCGLRDSCCM